MDPASLTVLVMTALGTFFGNAGTKVSEAAIEQAKRIFETIKARFSKEQDDGKASWSFDVAVQEYGPAHET